MCSVSVHDHFFPRVIEVDRDTEEQIAFREKIARFYAFGTPEMNKRVYQVYRFNVVFLVQGPKRDSVDCLLRSA